MASRSVRAIPAIRSLLVGASLLALAGCQTNQLVEGLEVGDAAPEAPVTVAKKNKGALPASASAYTDPLVVNVANGKKVPTAPHAAEAVSTAAPAPQVAAPANLGELTMQPTTVSAGRSSIFSAPAPAAAPEVPATGNPTAMPANTETAALAPSGNASSSIVPADLPSRAVSPMNKSLFSADLPEPIEPARETAVMPDYAEPAVPPKYDAAEPVSLAEEEAEKPVSVKPADTAEPEVATADVPQKKRKWLPSLSDLLAGSKKK